MFEDFGEDSVTEECFEVVFEEHEPFKLHPSELLKLKLYNGTCGCLAIFALSTSSSIKGRGAQHFLILSEVMAVRVDSWVKNTKLREAKSTSDIGS